MNAKHPTRHRAVPPTPTRNYLHQNVNWFVEKPCPKGKSQNSLIRLKQRNKEGGGDKDTLKQQ